MQTKAVVLFVAFALPCLLCIDTFGSVQVLEAWKARHAGQGNGKNFGAEVKVDSDGSIYVTGESYGPSNTNSAILTVRYNGSGSVDWTNVFNGPSNGFNQPRAMALDGSGHLYIAGTFFTGLGSNSSFMTIQMTTNHVVQWTALYDDGGVAGLHEAKAIAVDNAGNVYVSGVSAGSGGHSDFATIKYNSSGNQLWASRYNGPANGDEVMEAMVLDPAGNVYVTGTSDGGASGRDYATVKYGTGGNQIWVARYDGVGSGEDEARGLGVDSAGNVYVTGTSFGGAASDEDYATVKYDANGTQLWEARYDGPAGGGDYACGLAVDGAGHAYVTGESTDGASGYDDFITLKYDSNGVVEWINRYSGPGGKQDVPTAIAVDGAGTVYVTGESVGAGSSTDYATVAYDGSGSQLWAVRFNGSGNKEDSPTALAVDGAGNVYVHGHSHGTSGEFDYATVKYTQSVTVGDLVITDRPMDTNVLAGQNASFSVGVSGSGPFTYQWQFNGTNLAGKINSTLVVNNAPASAQGDYRVQVTSPSGSSSSAQARLMVGSLPVIVKQPESWPNILKGGAASFYVTAIGTRPLHYQWLFAGVPMANQTNSVLVVPSVQLSDAGNYQVSVSNQFNSVLSQTAALTVSTPVPVITWPNPANITYGTSLSTNQLNATADLLGSFVYNPPTGTLLNASNSQVLKVIFTPENLVSYSKVTNTVVLNVLRAPLTITANNTNKVYGAALPTFTASFSGLTNGDTAASLDTPVSLTTIATAASAVGTYPITASGAADANYTITFASGTLTVTRAPLTITANDTNKVVGAANPTFTASFSGLTNGDTAASLDTPVSLTTTATAGSPVGTYPITASGAADANYTISFVNGTLTVNPVGATAFVTGRVLGSLRNDFSGWVGMKITVGANAVTVTELGRLFVNGNSGTHVVKLVRASDQVDVSNGAISVPMTGGGAGQFKYGGLSSPVTLAAGTAYYLVSQEINGGDQWHELSSLTTTSVATCDSAAYFGGGYPWSVWGGAGQSYVPVDFKYTTGGSSVPTVTIAASDATAAEPGSDTGQLTVSRSGSTAAALTVNYTVGGTATAGTDYVSIGSSVTIPASSPSATIPITPINDNLAEGPETVVVTLAANALIYAIGAANTATVTIADDEPSGETAFVTGGLLGSLRNDFSGWVGMKITVGANAVTVTELGRLFANGNSGTHVVKLVRASDQVDVPNGAISLPMTGGSADQFKYGGLSSPVTLAAGTAYYLVSQEINGGDQWHELSSLTTTSVATCDSAAYFGGGYPWSVWGGPGQSYVPVDFKYTTGGSSVPTVTITASDATAAEPGSDTGQLTVSRSGSTAAALTVNYTVGGTATAGTDYVSIGSSVTIPAGSPSATIPITPINDNLAEGPETVVVTLAANAVAYAIGAANSATVTIADDEPSGETAFVTGGLLGGLRNDFSGWVGMKITVGANAVTVTELGRLFANGNIGTHVVKLVRASDQVDVPNGAISLPMTGGSADQFKYGGLSSPVTLAAGTAYYLVSQEINGGDQWHELSSLTTTSVGTCDSAAYFGGGYPWSVWGGPGQSYVPVDFKYTTGGSSVPTVTITASDATAAEPGSDTGQLTVSRSGSTAAALTVNYTVGGTATAGTDYVSIGSSVTIPAGSPSATIPITPINDNLAEGPETVVVTLAANAVAYAIGAANSATVTIADDEPSSVTAFVTGRVLGGLRNDFSGWVGMKITVGANAVTVTELGRLFANGNIGTHVVKLVRASDQVDVPNGAISLPMAGGSADQFKYGGLSSPVTLAAGTAYYLVSQEINGGDQWHELSSLTTTSVGTCDSAAYFGGGYPWSVWGGPGQSYVPVDFKYVVGGSP